MFHKSLLKAYIVLFLILVVCLLPGSSLPTVGVEWVSLDKFVHLVMYIPLVWTLAYGFRYQSIYPKLKQRRLFFAFIVACVYGALVELLQFALTPDRAAELYDFFADAAGAAIGVLTVKLGEYLIDLWNRIFSFMSPKGRK